MGKPLQAWKPRERAKLIGLTLTDPPASAALTASQVVALGRYPHTGFWGRLTARDKEMGAYALKITGMAHKADCPLGELSDGERQKVFLAKALAQEAALLVMDEPTAFLDAPHRTETFALLAHLVRHTGLCVLMATHEVALARKWAQTLWILDSEGLHCGPPAQMEDKMQWTRPGALNLEPPL